MRVKQPRYIWFSVISFIIQFTVYSINLLFIGKRDLDGWLSLSNLFVVLSLITFIPPLIAVAILFNFVDDRHMLIYFFTYVVMLMYIYFYGSYSSYRLFIWKEESL